MSTLIVLTLILVYHKSAILLTMMAFLGLLLFCLINLKLYKDLENDIEQQAKENYSQEIALNRKEQQITSLKFNSNINQIDHHSIKNIFSGLQGMIARQQLEIEAMKAVSEEEKRKIIVKMENLSYITEHLSAVLRNVVANRNEFQITLYQELDFVQHYIELEKLRFNDATGNSTLQVYFSLTDEVEKAKKELIVPKSFLWTYINNAILHGIERKATGAGKVIVQLDKNEEYLLASIEDDGVGFEKSKAYNKRLAQQMGKTSQQNHAGLELVREMYKFWNEKTSPIQHTEEIIALTNENKEVIGTLVKVKLPIVKHLF